MIQFVALGCATQKGEEGKWGTGEKGEAKTQTDLNALNNQPLLLAAPYSSTFQLPCSPFPLFPCSPLPLFPCSPFSLSTLADTLRTILSDKALQNELLLTRLLDAGVEGLLAFDRECRYIAWNKGMERIAGLKREDVLGKCAFDLFPFLKETGEDKCLRAALV